MRGARLGQHFLKHGWAARALARSIQVQPGEVILEIGPGKGFLTKELLQCGSVIAIEKDPPLVALLKDTFADEISSGALRLVEADVRDVSAHSLGLARFVVAANIPYYITGEIIRSFLSGQPQPRAMALLIQKEVAQRIVDEKGSLLSLSVKAYGSPRIIEKVSRIHFSPPPTVDSAILLVEHISRSFFDTVTEEAFFSVLRAGFAQKRKLLSNNLAGVYGKEGVQQAYAAAAIPPKARAEDLTLAQWKSLAIHLATTGSSQES